MLDICSEWVIYRYHDRGRRPKVAFFSMGGSLFFAFPAEFLPFCLRVNIICVNIPHKRLRNKSDFTLCDKTNQSTAPAPHIK